MLRENQRNDLQDGKTYSGQLRIERALSATIGIAFSGSTARESLKDPGYSTTGWRLGLLGWRDLGRVTLTAEAQFGKLHADERFPDCTAVGIFEEKAEGPYARCLNAPPVPSGRDNRPQG